MEKDSEASKAKSASKFSKPNQLARAGVSINHDLNFPKRSVTKIAYMDKTPPDSRQKNHIYTASETKPKQ
jgi:hypothetical protein